MTAGQQGRVAVAMPSPGGPVRRPGAPRHRHSPRVRRLAHDAGVDLAVVGGTGPGGRVTPDDVARAVAAQPVAGPVAASVVARQAGAPGVARRSFRTLVAEVDVSPGFPDRAPDAAAGSIPPPGPGAAGLVVAVAGALRGHRTLLAQGQREGVHLAVSWSSGSGDGAALLARADDLNVSGVEQRLADGARSSVDPGEAGLAVSLVQDGHVLFEVEGPPAGHVAHLSVGAPTARVAVVDADGVASIGIRLRSYVALSYDPTAVTRDTARSFLEDVARRAVSRP